MSIFIEQHHNASLLERLSINDIARLSQINKYYYNLTKDRLQSFRTFYNTKDTIPLEIVFDTRQYWYLSKFYKISRKYEIRMIINLREKSKVLKLMIQAYLHGDLEIIKYISNKTRALLPNTNINVSVYNHSNTYSSCRYNLVQILVLITIYTKRTNILLHLNNFYGDFSKVHLSDLEQYLEHILDQDFKYTLRQGGYKPYWNWKN